MEPYLYGGGMIRKVTFEDSTWDDLPWKFEPGTPPIAEAVGLVAAIDWLEELGMERIEAHEEELARYAYDQLAAEPGVEIYGPEPGPERGGLVGFNLESVHAHDLASIMNDHTVCDPRRRPLYPAAARQVGGRGVRSSLVLRLQHEGRSRQAGRCNR